MRSIPSHILKCAAFTTAIIMLVFPTLTHASDQETATLTGTVLDEDNDPIPNATIRVSGPGNLRRQGTTDSSGRFQIVVDREGWYSVYAVCNRSETPGVDYVPSLWQTHLQLGSTATFTFALERGASLYLDEELWFVESNKPVDYCRFTATRPNGEPLSGKHSVYTYGSGTELVWLSGFRRRLVVIPAETEVVIEALAEINSPRISRTFTIKGKTGPFKLSQGETSRIDVREHSLDVNVANLRQMLDSAFSLLKDADYAGFLVTVERQELLDAYNLIDTSLISMRTGLYDESFAELRRAYLSTRQTIDGLQGLLQIGSQSAFLLSLLFVFVASASAYLMTDRGSRVEVLFRSRNRLSISFNFLIAAVSYAALFSSFYFSYPGCRLVPQTTLVTTAVFVFLVGQLVVMASPRALSEKEGEDRSIQFRSAVISAFSMACRNLRRRKLRTTLTLANTAILIFGFITFTSISPGYGLVGQQLRPTIPVDALFIRDVPPSPSLHFIQLPSSIITWLESHPEVTLISPKAENAPIPASAFLGSVYAESGKKLSVQGIVGIIPSVEAVFTRLNNTVVHGKYLRDEDNRGVLVSASLREALDVGDELYGFRKEFAIVGFFDPSALSKLVDVDGQLFIPKVLDMSGPVSCPADQLIIVVYETALTLPKVGISRVNIQLENPDHEDYSSLAEVVALTREYQVYVSHPNSLHRLYLGIYTEEKGVGLLPFLLALVVVNIAASMLGSVKERKNEIASLSSVGLNPTHIAALFMAEAAILGLIGGGLGYLFGIAGYRLAAGPYFGALEVREKASAEWGLIALLISGFAAVLASMMPALQASTIVTPSLSRKWRIEEKERPGSVGEPWSIDLPIRLVPGELEPFMAFILKRLRERVTAVSEIDYVSDVRFEEETTDRGPLKKISFNFYPQEGLKSENDLMIQQVESGHFDVELLCSPLRNAEESVRRTGIYIRKLILEWNAMRLEVAAPYDGTVSQLYTLVNTYNPTTLYLMTTESDVTEQLEPLKRVLIREGIRPPKIVIARVDPLDVESCMKTAEELVSRAEIVCISGGPDVLCTTLAISARTQKKMTCFVIDPRPMRARTDDPFQVLKVANM